MKLVVLAVLVGAVAVIGCEDDGGTGGSGGTAGSGGTGGMPAEGCANPATECATCTPGSEAAGKCAARVSACNQADPSDRCDDCIAFIVPDRDCNGTGGTGGTGGTTAEDCADPDVECADCAGGTEDENCRAIVATCNGSEPPDRCQPCISYLDPSGDCGGTGGTGGSGGTTGKDCADPDVECAGCASGPPLNDCQADVWLCNQIDNCQECIDETNPGC